MWTAALNSVKNIQYINSKSEIKSDDSERESGTAWLARKE